MPLAPTGTVAGLNITGINAVAANDRNGSKSGGANTYNILEFGAKGDGKTLNTAAIQSAIDKCYDEKGGTVLLPAGDFLCGTIELKSNVTLRLSAQGKLLGSPQPG